MPQRAPDATAGSERYSGLRMPQRRGYGQRLLETRRETKLKSDIFLAGRTLNSSKYLSLKMAEQREPFTVAIIGGGIGGLFAALSVHHHCAALGISINVYEQTSEYKEIGAGVGIGINAAQLIHKLGLGEAANKIAGDRNGVWLAFRRSDNGAEIVTVLVNDRDAVKQLPMLRSEFLDLLLDSIRGRNAATLHTKKKCTRLVVSTSPNSRSRIYTELKATYRTLATKSASSLLIPPAQPRTSSSAQTASTPRYAANSPSTTRATAARLSTAAL